MPMKKYPLEQYQDYTIFIISGIVPTMFTAEKSDPSKGITITDDSLDAVKAQIDKTMAMATRLHINTWNGPVVNQTFQNPKVSCEHNPNGLAIIVESPYDLDIVVGSVEARPLRRSKRFKRHHNNNFNLLQIRILRRPKTFE